MALIQLKNIDLHYGDRVIFDRLSLQIQAKQRIALIGRNGSGKSTLLKVIQGVVSPDGGTIESQPFRLASLSQDVPRDLSGTIYDNVLAAHETSDDWQHTHTIDRIISQLNLDPEQPMAQLSGGGIRRCLLAQALVNEPDILLLDEPTNHMDVTSIEWLEQFLIQTPITLMLITHDRQFLQNVATRIIELDRGHLTSWEGDYQGFLRHKEQQLIAEERADALFDKKLAQEEVWIRQGIKARRTRNEGRVRALKKMRQERSQRREKTGQMQLTQQVANASGRLVCVADTISVTFDEKPIIQAFSCIIQRGDKIGIIGPNGCGKTTLIQCLLNQRTPDTGNVSLGTQLTIAYFDQHREQLDPNDTVMDAVSEGRSHITINGQSKHAISYLQDFLFSPEKARSKISTLSGGEHNRLLLAKLFATPANCYVLDEPTNDLDIESLELLESHLVNFDGTVIIVSHDRAFLNNVISASYVFGEHGHITEYVGGYESRATQAQVPTPQKSKKNTLSHQERKELNKLPGQIEKLEAAIQALQDTINGEGFYSQPDDITAPTLETFTQKEEQLATLYERWETLSEKE